MDSLALLSMESLQAVAHVNETKIQVKLLMGWPMDLRVLLSITTHTLTHGA